MLQLSALRSGVMQKFIFLKSISTTTVIIAFANSSTQVNARDKPSNNVDTMLMYSPVHLAVTALPVYNLTMIQS